MLGTAGGFGRWRASRPCEVATWGWLPRGGNECVGGNRSFHESLGWRVRILWIVASSRGE